MKITLEKRVQFLTTYVIIISLLCIYLVFSAFKASNDKLTINELTVKRINVVDETGHNLRLVISNETRQHSGRANGKDLPRRDRPAGLIFFNNDGDECGGLVYSVEKNNGKTFSNSSLTMDQLHNDQVVQITNEEVYDADGNESVGRRGLVVNTIPFGANLERSMEEYKAIKQITDSAERKRRIKQLMREEGITNRLFVGRNEDGEYGMFLFDATGRYRFKLFVDQKGNPQMQTIDLEGNVKEINLLEQ